ncbi:hypothetical protein F5B21DRAFT_526778 [Xylaria acuta]|nr:hypothetical protein F5B21DRAFT_526778 [Xylaria acuta]
MQNQPETAAPEYRWTVRAGPYMAILQALTLHRPSNERELLLVPGIGKGKAAQYGPAWLEVIADFEREQKQDGDDDDDDDRQQDASDQAKGDPHPELEERDPKRRRIVRVGCSKERLILSGESPAVLSIGLSFHDDDGSVFGPPIELPSSSVLKRKRDVAVPSDTGRQSSPPQSGTQAAAPILEPVSPVKVEPAVELMSATNVDAKPPSVPAFTSAPTSTLAPIPASTAARQHLQTPLGRFGWERTTLRNKLEAYIKSVV